MMLTNRLKRYSMRKPPQLGNDYSLISLSDVKMSLTWGRSAWAKSPSETKRSAFSSSRSLSDRIDFYNWLVGFTDGDGTFYFARTKKGYWTFAFKISQSSYNLRALYFIKSQLKVGQVSISKDDATYRIRNQEHLLEYIVPIFDQYPLLSSKNFQYKFFKKALLINQDPTLHKDRKDLLITRLKTEANNISDNCISSAWKRLKSPLRTRCKKEISQIMAKSWVVGFTEAEGSFYIVKKGSRRLVHAFEITQKEPTVLEAIGIIFDLKVTKKKSYYTIVTSRKEIIEKILSYFFKTMKGMKSFEYRIWARSFVKHRGNFNKLSKIREQMRNARSLRFDKNFKRLK